ncbi:MAG: ADP-ribose-binding protein [Patescibacteria group bacterium]|nr:ADP-ribose-binding protein [Patescibacteria group bacterium]
MKELCADWFDVEADAKCFPTNGVVKKNGHAVMGRGLAKQVADRWPSVSWWLGQVLESDGNHVRALGGVPECDRKFSLVSFPTKNDWRDKSDLGLVRQSGVELVQLTDFMRWKKVILPRPGCDNGGLNWREVKPVLEEIFDGRFVIVDLAS